MRTPRVFVPDSGWVEAGQARVEGKDAAHLTRVLRLETGAGVMVLDGNGRQFLARIQAITPGDVLLEIVNEVEGAAEPGTRVTLIQGLAKGEKMDLVVQKATEVGVTRIVPLRCERSVVHLESGRAEKRLQRWRKIAVEAAEQCGRSRVPLIEQPTDLAACLALARPRDLALFLWEGERQTPLRDVLSQRLAPGTEVFLFIGPEGGFSDDEVQLAGTSGAITVSLGSRILRTETAGLIATAIVLYETGDLG